MIHRDPATGKILFQRCCCDGTTPGRCEPYEPWEPTFCGCNAAATGCEGYSLPGENGTPSSAIAGGRWDWNVGTQAWGFTSYDNPQAPAQPCCCKFGDAAVTGYYEFATVIDGCMTAYGWFRRTGSDAAGYHDEGVNCWRASCNDPFWCQIIDDEFAGIACWDTPSRPANAVWPMRPELLFQFGIAGDTAQGWIHHDCRSFAWNWRYSNVSGGQDYTGSYQRGAYQMTTGSCEDDECPPTGACCCHGICLPNLTAQACADHGGEWRGADTICDEEQTCGTGACCLSSQACIEVLPEDCEALSGTFVGGDCDDAGGCEPTGACCTEGGGCFDGATFTECSAGAGFVWYPGQTCEDVDCTVEPRGCCCKPDGSKETMPNSECDTLGGTWDPNPDCGQVFCEATCCACCLQDATCVTTATQAECTALNGTWHSGFTCAQIACELESLGGGDEGEGLEELAKGLGFGGLAR